MLFRKSKPSDTLKKYVECYWVAQLDEKQVIREINPSSNISVCFHLEDFANYRLLPNDFCKGQNVSFDTITKWVNDKPTSAQNVIIGPHRRLIIETSEKGFCAFGIEFSFLHNPQFFHLWRNLRLVVFRRGKFARGILDFCDFVSASNVGQLIFCFGRGDIMLLAVDGVRNFKRRVAIRNDAKRLTVADEGIVKLYQWRFVDFYVVGNCF